MSNFETEKHDVYNVGRINASLILAAFHDVGLKMFAFECLAHAQMKIRKN